MPEFVRHPARHARFEPLGRVCRLGLSTRGDSRLDEGAVRDAIDAGVNYLNWCGHADGMSRAVRAMTADERSAVRVAVQLSARDAPGARQELHACLGELGTGHVDVVTYYYVEHPQEWEQIIGRDGAADALQEARADGRVRAIGVTSHQRPLAARIAGSGRVDLLMIRYNAAHRGAEEEIFPVTNRKRLPVVAYTALRWGKLMEPTPDDPPGYAPPAAPRWYRFVLCQRAVTVVLMAPADRGELREDLLLLADWQGLGDAEYAALRSHGDRVRRHAGRFP